MSRPAAAFVLVLTASLVLIPESASAQEGVFGGLKAIVDYTFSSISTTTTNASGPATTTTTNSRYPRLTVNIDSRVYPNLRLNAGGVFEINQVSSTINGLDVDSTISRLNPFFLLRSTNVTLSPGVGYFRREDRARVVGLLGVKLVSEDYAAYLGWRPDGLPQSDFQFVRTNTFDDTRTFQDVTKDFGSLVSRYTYRGLGVNYHGSYLGTTNRMDRLQTREWSNAARVDYSTALLEKRLLWNTTYNVNHADVTTAASGEGGGEAALPLIPVAGLALLSDTPVTATLSLNPPLVDGNLSASTGINLGLPDPGTPSPARNIGLDFANPTQVNRLLIWVDRDLPVNIAASFSWEVYSSADNLVWKQETLVSAAPFGPFENRFQVDFPNIAARYVKVVTRPLSAAVVDSSRFPDIFVTEMQAFLRRSAHEALGTVTRTGQILNTDARMRILDTPSLFYEGSYWLTYTGLSTVSLKRDILSNGVSVNHRFGGFWSVYGRGALEQGTQPDGHRVATVTNATLTASPIRTFTTSLLYTGLDERIEERLNDRKSLFLQSNAQLYRGVDLQFGGGWTFTTTETGDTSRDAVLNASASIAPRQNVTLTFNYAGTRTTRSGTSIGIPESHSRRGYLTLTVDPVRTLHLVLAEEVVADSGQQTRRTHNLGANWAPFPDGSLQFIVAYNEALRSLEFGTESVFRSAVRWTFSRQSYIDVSYQKIESELVSQKTRSKVFSVDLRWFV